MNDATIRSTDATPLKGRSCLELMDSLLTRGPPLGLGEASLHPRCDVNQQPHSVAAGVVAGVLAADVPGGAGDVDMGPRGVSDEFLQERRGGDRSRLALGGEVG